MNMGKERLQRKKSLGEPHSAGYISPDVKSRRRRSLQAKRSSRDRDFFAPDEVEEWVLPEYRSLFHHLFLKEEEDSIHHSGRVGNNNAVANPGASATSSDRRRKVSSTGSGNSSASEEDGALGNFTKHLPSWLKKIFHLSDTHTTDEQQQTGSDMDRHAWLDEIPIEICDKLRHIHIYV